MDQPTAFQNQVPPVYSGPMPPATPEPHQSRSMSVVLILLVVAALISAGWWAWNRTPEKMGADSNVTPSPFTSASESLSPEPTLESDGIEIPNADGELNSLDEQINQL